MDKDAKIAVGALAVFALCFGLAVGVAKCKEPRSRAEIREIEAKCQRVADRAPCGHAASPRRCEQAVLDECLEEHGL